MAKPKWKMVYKIGACVRQRSGDHWARGRIVGYHRNLVVWRSGDVNIGSRRQTLEVVPCDTLKGARPRRRRGR